MTVNRRTLLVIGGRVETVRKARDLGLRVVNVQRPEEYRPEHAPWSRPPCWSTTPTGPCCARW